MAKSKITTSFGPGGVAADHRTPPQSGIARQSLLKLAAVTGALTGVAMTARMTAKATADGRSGPCSSSGKMKTICTSCSVGCGLVAEVENGVWLRQEIAAEHPVSSGAHCGKGASAIDMVNSPRRLKNPMKKVAGKWVALSWEKAIEEIGARLLAIRATHGPDALHFHGSAKVSTEMAYLQRKFAAFWGSNNIDHQARFRQSATVVGVAATFGYGAMTNSVNDMRHARSFIFIGANPPAAQPVAMQHILVAKERYKAPLIVVDPRRSKLAAKASDYIRIRPGTDGAFMMGLVNVIIANGWEDKEFIRTSLAGYAEMVEVARDYTPEEVAKITGIPAGETVRIARLLAENRPTSLTWGMGGTQHSSSSTRSFCILQLVLGNMGKSGGGTNFLVGHDNVQGATDMGVLADSLPGYYGLTEEAWQHWCRVWGVEYEWMISRFQDKDGMTRKGLSLARWYDSVLQEEEIHQYSPVKALIQWGCGSSSGSRYQRVVKAYDMLELLVVVDPFPTMAAVAWETDNIYLLPSTSQYETSGSVTSTSRQVQWRHKVVEPVHNSKDDYRIMALLVKKLGFAEQFYRNIRQVPEDISRELGRGALSIGYNGQTPERIKKHMENWHTFDIETLQATGGPCAGEYYGLPWPCWSEEHPGTPILYDMSKPAGQDLPFRNQCGPEKIYDVSGRLENVRVESPAGGRMKVKAFLSERVDEKTVFLPCHFAGALQGLSLIDRYPEETAPLVVGEAGNVVTNYGYDSITRVQAAKAG